MIDDDAPDGFDEELAAVSDLVGTSTAGLRVVRTDKRTMAQESLRLLGIALDDFGTDVPNAVRMFLTVWARRLAVAGFWSAMADQHGLVTEQGIVFENLALRHEHAASKAFASAMKARDVIGKRKGYVPTMYTPKDPK